MKRIFYACFCLHTVLNLSAQTPGGISGSVLWLNGNSATSSNWPDHSGTGNGFSQSTTANQPALNTNVFNFNPALSFDGTSSFMTQPAPGMFPENDADRSIFIVANAGAVNGYRWVFVYGSPGSLGATCQMGNHDAGLVNAFYGIDETAAGYWSLPDNANGTLSSFTLTSSIGSQYDKGALLQSLPITGLSATSVNGVIGALDATPTELWSGSIAEVIMFNTGLSDASRNQVESYLALKYGFTLGASGTPISYLASDGNTFYWFANTIYQHDVFGIGTDGNTGLVQTQSNSMNSGSGNGTGQSGKGNLVLSSPTPLADGQFLMIGNDAGALTEQTINTGEAIPMAEGSQRVMRNWLAQNTGTVGAVDLSFDMTGLSFTGGNTPANYRLMIDEDGDGDYASGTPSFISPSSINGNLITFTGVTLNADVIFTLITQASASLLPAVWQGFTVTAEKNRATLVWKTSDEINVDHYTAEYSTDGISFLSAGSVPAKNGAGVNTYTLVQDNLAAGIRYYHIKRFDKDGRFQVSDIKSIRINAANTLMLRANPVDAGRLLELTIQVQQNQHATLQIAGASGSVLLQRNASLSPGTNSVSINIASLSAGVYFLHAQLGNEIINKKFVKF